MDTAELWADYQEVMMLVTFAFAWWLVSFPTPVLKAPATSGITDNAVKIVAHEAAAPAESSTEEADTVSVSERVKLHGPITPAIVRLAQSFLDLPMGAERIVDVAGRRYAFVLERHYHPPGFVGGPTGWHKGVTVYEVPIDLDGTD